MKKITMTQLRHAKIIENKHGMIGVIKDVPYQFMLLHNGGIVVYRHYKAFGYAVPPKHLGEDNWSLVLDIINNNIVDSNN